MRTFLNCILIVVLFVKTITAQQINTAKPWAYWWWMGSAVDSVGLKYNLEKYASAGFGGLHIIPIYGAKGQEANFRPYLSPAWLQMLNYTVHVADSLHMGIDMTLGTGWPFGGAQVSQSDGAQKMEIINENGQYRVVTKNTNQKVKRAAPGAEGLVVDHFSKTAMQNYLKPFEAVFSQKNYGVRAFYNDSYEVYGANWNANFMNDFKKYRGYDLEPYLETLSQKKAESIDQKHFWQDYHQTLSDLLLNNFNPTWLSFAKKYKKLSRTEAHGSPANILDLYAQADIPEAEFFGSKPYNILGYRQDPDYDPSRYGSPGFEVVKLASSAANVTGKKLVASETATWLGNHFKVSLAQVKPIIDESILGGVNHIFYHGANYTPQTAGFPGWLFYASTNFNFNSHFWDELPLLNKYIETVQKPMQNSNADNELLIYLPIHDLWSQPGPADKLHFLNVHTILTEGIFSGKLGTLIKQLRANGFSYDFISDAQLANCTIKNGKIITKTGSIYKALIVPEADFMPLNTLQKINHFRTSKALLLFENKLPNFSTGLKNKAENQKTFEQVANTLTKLVSADLSQSLINAQILPEPMAVTGLTFIRKKTPKGKLYFIANQTNHPINTVDVLASEKYAWLNNPETGTNYGAISNGKIPIYLESGQSILLETSNIKPKKIVQFVEKTSKSVAINSTWQVDFVKGEPFLPKSISMDTLQSWTNGTDSSRKYFSGKALYKSNFKLAKEAIGHRATIHLGDVRESAKVKINGTEIGTAWCLPYNLNIPTNVLLAENTIEIEVTNLSANRMIYVDKHKIPWRNFYDINVVDINYKPFDASNWQPLPSGLLGPISLEF